jgi:alpha-mannosidase/mannosylglycerate hydrolase
MDLRSRPIPAGPGVPTPGAQCPGTVAATIALLPAGDLALARAVELGLGAVPAGESPVLEPGRSLFHVEAGPVVLSALKPADRGDGVVLRLLNPTDAVAEAVVRLGFPVHEGRLVRLDEEPDGDGALALDGGRLRVAVEPRRLRSVLLR